MTTREVSAKVDKFKSTLLVISFFFLIICVNCGCSASDGDSGSLNDDQSSMDMMENDPNILHIPNKQGYGKDIPDPSDLPTEKKPGTIVLQIGLKYNALHFVKFNEIIFFVFKWIFCCLDASKKDSKYTNKNNKNKDSKVSGEKQNSIGDQTLQAALQFGVLVRVLNIYNTY